MKTALYVVRRLFLSLVDPLTLGLLPLSVVNYLVSLNLISLLSLFSLFPNVSHLFHYLFLPPDGGKGKGNNESVNECGGCQSMVKGVVVKALQKVLVSYL